MKINLGVYFKKILDDFYRWFQPAHVLAIDLGDTFIHVLALASNHEYPCVLAYAYTSLPANIITFGVIQNIPLLAQILRELLADMPAGAGRVVLALPDGLTLHKSITVSKSLSSRQVESFVRMSVQKNVSTSMHVDFNLLDSDQNDHLMHDVHVIAAHTRDVQQRVDLLRHVGFEIDILDVRSSAVIRALRYLLMRCPELSATKTIGLIEFETISVSFYVIKDLQPVFKQTQVIDHTNHIGRVLQFFNTIESVQGIESLLVAGQHPDLFALADQLSGRLSLTTRVINLMDCLEFVSDVTRGLIFQHSSALLTALGLALR